MRYQKIDSKLFILNRQKFMEKMESNSMAIFCANSQMPTNADGTMGFIQNSNFFYFSGIDQEESYLVISKKDQKEILFVLETNEHLKIWEGEKLSPKEATEHSGIKTVKYSHTFWDFIKKEIPLHSIIYLHHDEQMGTLTDFKTKERFLIDTIKDKFPLHSLKRAVEISHPLRIIKQKEEIELIKKSIEISKKGFERAAKNIKAGIFEFELEAELSYEFIRNGSRYHAFAPIIASGKNACVLHYIQNDSKLNSGDTVLMDFGAEYANYKADVTRVLPINGKFSKRQSEVYNAVLSVLKQTKTMMVKGNTLENLKKDAKEILGEELRKLKLIKDKNEIQQYFPHGVSHFLGLDVHDVGNQNTIFEPGMLLTCEPGIYIREENLGIRLENDILITENGNIDLMEDFPIEIEEIEELTKK
jgi:Xaa-Pro aminopeptidase